MDLGFDGHVCAVTGASRGIGLATARLLAADGARVLLVGRDEGRVAEAAGTVGGEGLAADVTDPSAAQAIVERAEALGGLYALVNNAGTSFARPLEELTAADWQGQWELHVMGPMRLMRAGAPAMAARGAGRIVNVCSSAGKRPSLTNAAYSVTKAAQLSLSRVFADAHAAEGVLVNAVAPGAVATELWTGAGGLADQAAAAKGISREEALEAQAAKIPVGRLADEEEIAAVVAFLCSPRASAVAGAAWSADGGTVPSIV
ncbi:MAG TPA: SDR family oxidoreductase [Solirubrobacteraceae bacterium]|nr:SDR family oxidoreductase [Solirubrobacteraceae bacterium]